MKPVIRMCHAALLVILIATAVACKKQSAIVLNELREQVRKENGEPIKSRGQIDFWQRSTKKNDYRVRVDYRIDNSRSQFHPDEYVNGISLRPDKAAPLREMLEDLPEARQLCASGCSILGLFVYAFDNSRADLETLKLEAQIRHPVIFVCQGGPDHSVNWWRGNVAYQQCITILFQPQSYQSASAPPFDWASFRIEELGIEELRPAYELREYRWQYLQADDLGQWEPTS